MTKSIQPYNPNWATAFENIRQSLETALRALGAPVDIQHVGSTAIPGMYAKPVLDIDIIINNKNLLEDITRLLQQAGYQYKGEQGIPGRFAFRQINGFVPAAANNGQHPHHLYVCYADSLALKNHLLFRDALRNNKSLAEKYTQLKIALTDNLHITSEAYTTKKTDFIIAVLATAGLNEQELTEITNANA